MAVEWLWLERWRGRTPGSLLSPEEFPTLEDLVRRWQAVEGEMRAYLAGLSAEALEQPITCVSTRGVTWTYTCSRMMIHMLHHQSYHRGQVTTLLSQLGAQPPKVDFLDAHDAAFRI